MSETNTESTTNNVVTIKGRLINKHDTAENWDKAVNFAPLLGETIVYDPDSTHPYPRYKTGIWDGVSEKTDDMLAKNLPFTDVIKSDRTTTVEIGGIPVGASLKDKSVAEIIEDIFFPYVPFSFDSISTNPTSGTREYGDDFEITHVTPKFTAGSEAINSVKIGITEGGNELYEGTSATSETAIPLTTTKVYNGSSGGTIYCTLSDGETTDTKHASVSYTYYDYSKLTDSTTPATSGATKQTTAGADKTYSYTAGQYLWLYSRSANKKIQQYISGTWADVTTTSGGAITLTLASGATAQYYAYRTDKFAATGSARYRLA